MTISPMVVNVLGRADYAALGFVVAVYLFSTGVL